MKILFVKPTSHTDSITPPLGLGYLATALRPEHEVDIIDGPKVGLNPRKFARILAESKPDMVGFNVVSMDIYTAAVYLKVVREILPEAVTVVGGPHPSGEPEDTFYSYAPDLDYAFVGEAEKGIRVLADILERERRPSDDDLKAVPGLVWKRGHRLFSNPIYRERDLDLLGFAAWDLIDPRTYPHAPHAAFAKAFPVANISVTRGCPFECEFCAARKIQGRKIRRRSIGHVMEEIELLVNRFGTREIHIVDDNFTYKRDYALEFCEKLSRKFKDVSWTCPNGVRLDSLDEELLGAMKRSGCYAIAVGIESGTQAILDRVKKKQTIELVRQRVNMINDAGMIAVGFFGFGFHGETVEEMKNTINFSLSLPLSRAQYMFFHPMPGTDLYHKILKEHPEKLRDVYSTLGKVAYVEDGISESQLRWLHRGAFLRFYTRPRQFAQLITSMRSPSHAYYIVKRVLRWMINN